MIKFLNKFSLTYCFAILLAILISYSLARGTSDFSELISLHTENEPLAEVLDTVSRATGYELIFDENWNDLPITVDFEAMPLDQALKRILAKVNYAIIYRSDRKVLIRIYQKESGAYTHSGVSTINRNPHSSVIQSREIESSFSPDPDSAQPGGEETESEIPHEIRRDPEVAGEESEVKKDEEDEEDENKSAIDDSKPENQEQ